MARIEVYCCSERQAVDRGEVLYVTVLLLPTILVVGTSAIFTVVWALNHMCFTAAKVIVLYWLFSRLGVFFVKGMGRIL